MAAEFGTVGHIEDIGPMLKERWGGVLRTINFPTDFPLASKEDETHTRRMIELLHAR